MDAVHHYPVGNTKHSDMVNYRSCHSTKWLFKVLWSVFVEKQGMLECTNSVLAKKIVGRGVGGGGVHLLWRMVAWWIQLMFLTQILSPYSFFLGIWVFFWRESSNFPGTPTWNQGSDWKQKFCCGWILGSFPLICAAKTLSDLAGAVPGLGPGWHPMIVWTWSATQRVLKTGIKKPGNCG